MKKTARPLKKAVKRTAKQKPFVATVIKALVAMGVDTDSIKKTSRSVVVETNEFDRLEGYRVDFDTSGLWLDEDEDGDEVFTDQDGEPLEDDDLYEYQVTHMVLDEDSEAKLQKALAKALGVPVASIRIEDDNDPKTEASTTIISLRKPK